MRELTLSEKLEYFAKVERDEKPRKDLRKYIREQLQARGVPQRQMALSIGVAPSNFANFLNGKISSIPLSLIEHILWLLETPYSVEEEQK